MAGVCYSSLQIVRLRAAKLTAAGDALPGASSGYVSDSLIEATLGLEVEEGQEILKKNGSGVFCVNFKDVDRIKRATIGLSFCKLETELVAMLVNASTYTSSGTTTGFKVPAFDDPAPNGVTLELWTKAWDGDQQATLSGSNVYWHWVLPRAYLRLGDLTLNGDDSADLPVEGFSTANNEVNIDGPWNDWAQGVPAGDGVMNTPLAVWRDTSIPTAACAYQTVPAQGS